jgi:hypothetical protein
MNVNCFRIQIVNLNCVLEKDSVRDGAREKGGRELNNKIFPNPHICCKEREDEEGENVLCRELTAHNFSKSWMNERKLWHH